MQPEFLVVDVEDHPVWTPQELVDIFYRLLVNGWLDGQMSEAMAQSYGERLGHYGLLVLAHEQVVEDLRTVLRGTFGGQL
jgi:hypothetical protein